jgi:hypothetical protein
MVSGGVMTFLLLRALIFAPVAVVVIAAMRAFRALADLRLWRRLTRHQPVAVKDLSPGPAIVRGKVRLLGEPVKVPDSGESVVAYEISEPVNPSSTREATVFTVDDESGSVEVHPQRMRVGAAVDHVLYVDKLGMKTMPGLARPIRILRNGDEVLLIGSVHREADAAGQAGSYRAAPTKLVMRPGPQGLAAVRDVSSLIKYAAPTLIICSILIAAMVGGVGFALVGIFGCE